MIQKEREAEGDEFQDKEAFVTSSYKKKLEELKKLDQEDLKLSMIEDINDVTKQRDMGSFYRHLYKAELCKDEDKDKNDKVKKPITKFDVNRQYRKRASSNSSDANSNNDKDDKDTDISDSDSSLDLKKQKIDNSCDKNLEEGEIIEELEANSEKKSLSDLEKSKENLNDKSSNEELESKETKVKEKSKNKKTEKNGNDKPKEIKPRVNIWEKRTVGDVFEIARQRYFERKMKQINLRVRS